MLLMVADCWQSRLFDTILMKDLLAWVPDQGGHTEPFLDWQCQKVTSTFGMHPLWLSCWLCLANTLSNEEARKCLHHGDATLLAPVYEFERTRADRAAAIQAATAVSQNADDDDDDSGWPPGPRGIAQALPDLESRCRLEKVRFR